MLNCCLKTVILIIMLLISSLHSQHLYWTVKRVVVFRCRIAPWIKGHASESKTIYMYKRNKCNGCTLYALFFFFFQSQNAPMELISGSLSQILPSVPHRGDVQNLQKIKPVEISHILHAQLSETVRNIHTTSTWFTRGFVWSC